MIPIELHEQGLAVVPSLYPLYFLGDIYTGLWKECLSVLC